LFVGKALKTSLIKTLLEAEIHAVLVYLMHFAKVKRGSGKFEIKIKNLAGLLQVKDKFYPAGLFESKTDLY